MFILICIVLLMCPERATEGALEGIRLATESVIVSILPFFVFAKGLIYTGTLEKFEKVLTPVFKKMGINTKSITPFIVSLLAGYPSGGKIVCDMYEDKLITKREAESFLGFCNNGGIIFAVSVIGEKIFDSYITGLVIFIAQVIGALVAGRIFSREESADKNEHKKEKMTILASLGKSVADAGVVIGNVLAAFIVFHALIKATVIEKNPFLCGIVELTKGIALSGRTNNPPLAAFFFSFGSISVMAQTASFIQNGDLSLKKYVAGKLAGGIIAFILTFFVTLCMNY